MKKLVALVAVVAALAAAPVALGHHSALSVSKTCNTQTGQYDLVWTVGPTTDLDKAPKVDASNRAAIPVGTALPSLKTFSESIPGTSTSVSATIKVKWNNGVTDTRTAATELPGNCLPPPVCPEGWTPAGSSNGVLLCTKETIREVPVETIKTVEVPGPTQTVYVDKVVEVTKDVPGPTVTVTKVQWKTKVVNKVHKVTKVVYRTKYVRKIVRVCPIKPYPEESLTG